MLQDCNHVTSFYHVEHILSYTIMCIKRTFSVCKLKCTEELCLQKLKIAPLTL